MAPLYFGDAKVDIFFKQQRKINEFEKNIHFNFVRIFDVDSTNLSLLLS